MILETMTRILGVEKASIFLLSEEKGGYYLLESINLEIKTNPSPLLVKEDPLLQDLFKRGEIIIREELVKKNNSKEFNDIIERMSLLEAAISIPIFVGL